MGVREIRSGIRFAAHIIITRRYRSCHSEYTNTHTSTHSITLPTMSSSDQTSSSDASLLDQAKSAASIAAGHGSYAQGAAEEAIGNASGSTAWQESGQKIKSDAADAIKEAVNQAPEGGKIGELAEEACPKTGDGVGSKQV